MHTFTILLHFGYVCDPGFYNLDLYKNRRVDSHTLNLGYWSLELGLTSFDPYFAYDFD